ncbi:BMC domain-containing protein [Veillonella denticariosi JCM 15641]|uniref:BMC domain-containing protein n=1 Tax=Veillonella denticariosi JCM 15641 TaxID=1298594 RepID=A0A2S7ZA72_9FIRM|nr:BMC domain-containing protein [Veillonella denticariosi]PQL20161.1 BMC domain-containing protein [Veillonella denticariosi JCM 15641]
MVKDSLGLLEVAGLLGAITASDAMVKAANVWLLGIEKARGLGWMTVKVAGDVAAVEAAVQTGVAIAKGLNLYVAHKVIPRPAEGLVESFNDDFTDKSAKISDDTKAAKKTVDNESVKVEAITTVEEKSASDKKVVEVLDEIVSTIIEPKSSKSTGTKKTALKKSSKKK